MKFIEQKLAGLYLISPEPYEDKRGIFRRHFCQREFSEHHLMVDIKQCNISENTREFTLRGFHFQSPPFGENKLISCIRGNIHNIVLDVRPESNTYLKWQSFELSEKNRLSLYIPLGCANAFLTKQENTWVLYYHSEFFTPKAECGIKYNDPMFNFDWPADPTVISDKDANLPHFNQLYGDLNGANSNS